MDHPTIEATDVVERYLLGRLTAEEEAAFEEHYLDCPECLERLELGRRLRQGLRDVAAEERSRLVGAALAGWIARRGRLLGALLVVVLGVAAVLPWAILQPRLSRLGEELDRARSPQAGGVIYGLGPERSAPGAEPSTRVTLGPGPEWVTLRLDLPPSRGTATYRVRLSEADGPAVWQSGPLQPDASGAVTLRVHSSWLRPADYVAELEVVPEEGESSETTAFQFRVLRRAGE